VVVTGNAGSRAVARGSCRLVLALIAALALVGCSGPFAGDTSSQSSNRVQHASLSIGGENRTYRLFRPPSLDPKRPAPLLVALAGCSTTTTPGDDMAAITHLDDQATTGGFVVAYPDPVGGCWNTGIPCCSGRGDDVTFLNRLLDRLSTDMRIDKSRVFAAGASAGGVMGYRVACELSDRFTAIASVGGLIGPHACRPARPVSILEMHGTNDSVVPYTGGADAIEQWVTLDGCGGDPRRSVSGITKTSTWSNCQGGTVVRFDTVEGGHHSWFGSALDPVPGEPNSNATAWGFFTQLRPRA
jgi:polyhydroxybutyrate depolymerase